MIKVLTQFLNLIVIAFAVSACQNDGSSFTFESHDSKVFGIEKNYTLFLPRSYKDGNERFPVIYFFHGWGSRYNEEVTAKLEFDLIGDLVNKYQVILVMWDGNMEALEPRPYNIGDHSDVKFQMQMKDYFLELVDHVDSTYRTKNDRNSRGIIGFSMGGYMSFFLSGKYPDMVCAAVNLTGSPEFFIGYPDNHTLYPLRYTFTNLQDVKLLFHNSSIGELSPLNREVNNGVLWEHNLDYQYWEFEGGHKIDDPGETVVFEKAMKFVSGAFKYPKPRKETWSHYDLYSDFKLWDYAVTSDKEEPGFIYLKNVSNAGFGLYTKKWLPLGPSIDDCNLNMKTAPVYKPNTLYTVARYNCRSDAVEILPLKSDGLGRHQFSLTGSGYEIGIYKSGQGPKITLLDYEIDKTKRLLRVGKENKLSLKLANLGELVDSAREMELMVGSYDESVTMETNSVSIKLDPKNRIMYSPPITITTTKQPPADGSPSFVKFFLTMGAGVNMIEDSFVVPVFFDMPYFKKLSLDDGRIVNDSVFGVGNGDGIVNPGEEVMIYTGDHRTQVFVDDPYVDNLSGRVFDEILPAIWEDGVTLSSIIKVSDRCPPDHVIELIANYETKSFNPIERKVVWGRVKLTVAK